MPSTVHEQNLSTEMVLFLREHDIIGAGMLLATEELSMTDLRKMSHNYEDFLEQMRKINVPLDQARIMVEALRAGPGGANEGSSSAPLLLTAEVTDDVKANMALLQAAGKAQQQQQRPTATSVFDSDVLAAALGAVSSAPARRAAPAPRPKPNPRETHFSNSPLSYESWKAGKDPDEVLGKGTSPALKAYQTRAADVNAADDGVLPAGTKGTLIIAPESDKKIVKRPVDKHRTGSWFV